MREIKVQKENMERITKMVADEVQALKTQCDRERENARLAKVEADKVNKLLALRFLEKRKCGKMIRFYFNGAEMKIN